LAESTDRPVEESTRKAAELLMQALDELQRNSPAAQATLQARDELVATRTALQQLAARFEQQIVAETEQRIMLAGQLTSLATSLDRLVSHLQDLGDLMGGVIERINEAPSLAPVSSTPEPKPSEPPEPPFLPGGEGVSLAISGVPGFQVLMDIQKALVGMEQVVGASVERFQEGDSRILVHLNAPLRATDLAADLRTATGQTLVVEESRPGLMSLRLRFLAS